MTKLYLANIFHKRFLPRVNQFEYEGFYLRLNIDKVEKLNTSLFSVDRFNLFSFYHKDHGYKDKRSLRSWVVDQLVCVGINKFCGRVELQTFPRVLGHVFNPVSFWFCYEEDLLVAVICEVNNTFGESHNYVIKMNENINEYKLPKEFHVSPFYPVAGYYVFKFVSNNNIIINYINDSDLQLTTSIEGSELFFNNRNLIRIWMKFPLYSLRVLALIHFQALKLFLKKNKFYKKPEKIKREVTYEHTNKVF